MSRRKLGESIKKIVAHKQKYCCYKCGKLLPPSFQVDHIIPLSISLNDNEDNLQALCPNCHSLKTQRENLRIVKYKKVLELCPVNTKLCWFCLETTTSFKQHNIECNKIIKDIDKIKKNQKKTFGKMEEILSKYKYFEKDLVDTFNKMNINNVIKCLNIVINLDEFVVVINKEFVYKLQNKDMIPSDIADAIVYYFKNKGYLFMIDTIEFDIIYPSEPKTIEFENQRVECFEYISEILLNYVPDDVIQNKKDVYFILN